MHIPVIAIWSLKGVQDGLNIKEFVNQIVNKKAQNVSILVLPKIDINQYIKFYWHDNVIFRPN